MNSEPPKEIYAAMTVNERLFVAGLLVQFDKATQTGNRAEMIELLRRVEIDIEESDRIVDAVLRHPTRYGRLNPQP